MRKKDLVTFSVGVVALFVAASCSVLYPRLDGQGRPKYEYIYHVPEEAGDGLESSSLVAEGVDLGRVEELVRNILNGTFDNIHSVLLAKNGKLVLEEYFYGYDRDQKHQLRSATKSVTSILIGIAKDQGMIDSPDQKLSEFFPGYKELNWDEEKDKITLRHVLTMTAGLDWNERSVSR